MANSPILPRTALVLALKVLYPRKPLRPEQTEMIAHPKTAYSASVEEKVALTLVEMAGKTLFTTTVTGASWGSTPNTAKTAGCVPTSRMRGQRMEITQRRQQGWDPCCTDLTGPFLKAG